MKVPSDSEIKLELAKLDQKGLIDLSLIDTPIRFKRILEHIQQEARDEPYLTKKELYGPKEIMQMILSKNYNWTRPENAPKRNVSLVNDVRKLGEEERQELLDYPLDELKAFFETQISIIWKVKGLSNTQLSTLAEHYIEQYRDPIFNPILWSKDLLESLVQLTKERIA